MSKDFTLTKYDELLQAYTSAGYDPFTLERYLLDRPSYDRKCVILRHDVDKLPENALDIAEIEHEHKMKGSFYFRIVKESFDTHIIQKIAELGHEIGYHYEDLALAKGNMEKAVRSFQENLGIFRRYYPVRTVCMHGSPLSPFDNRKIFEQIDRERLNILGEPYFDLGFDRILYLTDTGRRWDGEKASIRDHVEGIGHGLHNTNDIITALGNGELSNHILQNIHPQRWTDDPSLWWKERILQSIKNAVKRMIKPYRG